MASALSSRRIAIVVVALLMASCHRPVEVPARFVPHPDAASKRIEYFVERPSGRGPWPTVVLLHGHQEGARRGGRDFVDRGVLQGLAARGYLAVAAVITRLRERGEIADGRLLIEGISRGARRTSVPTR